MNFLLHVSIVLLTTLRMHHGNVYVSAGMRDACVASCLERISRDSADKSSSATAQQLYATPAAAQDSASTAASGPASLPTWSMHSADPFSQCMQRYCAATEPTKYNPEVSSLHIAVTNFLRQMKFLFVMFCGISLQWPLVNESHPFIRLDFILVSPAILLGAHAAAARASNSNSNSNSGSVAEGLRAGVERSNITEALSDHFPVFAAWRDPSRPTIPLY